MRVFALLAWIFVAHAPAVMFAANPPATQPAFAAFYPFDNGTDKEHLSLEAQARLLKELGYPGIGYADPAHVPEMLKALDAEGLKMISLYTGVSVAANQRAYGPELPAAIRQLKDRGTILLLHLRGAPASSSVADDRALATLRELADLAAASDLRIAIYPHVNEYVATVQDALRLARKVDRQNVGICFNLCHFLATDEVSNLNARLRAAAPRLFLVSVNGADPNPPGQLGWNHDRLLQRLDRGRFDLRKLLGTLRRLGYRGPIALQCYQLKGDARENLRQALRTWRKLQTTQPAE